MPKTPCGKGEPEVADLVERCMSKEGFTPGERECHDAQPGKLRVDFVYPDARPHPIALEVTSITDPRYRKGVAATPKMMESLSRTVADERLGSWFVAVSTEVATMKELEPEVLKIIRSAQVNRDRMIRDGSEVVPGDYTADDLLRLPGKEWATFIAEHDRVRALGIHSVKPFASDEDPVVLVVPTTGVKSMESFVGLLDDAIASNIEKLKESGLSMHLAVYVDRVDASPIPSRTAVPDVQGLERLWVVQPWARAEGVTGVWVAGGESTDWTVY